MTLILPNNILNDTPADAVPVEQNYSVIEHYVNTEVITRDGSVAMTSPLLLVGDPTSINHASNKGYVDARDTVIYNSAASFYNALDATKANKSYVDSQDATKADKSYVDSQDTSTYNAAVAFYDSLNATKGGKADTNYWLGENFFSQAGSTGGNPGLDAGGVWISRAAHQISIYNQMAGGSTANIWCKIGGPSDIEGKWFIGFARYDSPIGSITAQAGGGSVAYNTSSDARLKEVLADLDPAAALDTVSQLHPVRYVWKADADRNELTGFLAHEVDAVIPEAVTGEADAVDAGGNVDPQQLDRSAMIPFLVAAVQALTARVAELEAAA